MTIGKHLRYKMINSLKFYLQKYPALAQFARFAIVGTIGAVVDFGSYAIITRGLNYSQEIYIFGYPIIVANMISVFLAIISNFFWNKYWTFRDLRSDPEVMFKQWVQFFSFSAVTYVLNQILVSFFVFYTSLEVYLGRWEDIIAKAIAIGIILFLNFGISKFIVFKKKVG